MEGNNKDGITFALTDLTWSLCHSALQSSFGVLSSIVFVSRKMAHTYNTHTHSELLWRSSLKYLNALSVFNARLIE